MKHLKTFEQFSQISTEETNEGILDFAKGIKKYKLQDIELTPNAKKEFLGRKGIVDTLKKSILKSKLGLMDEKVDQAIKAIFNFANGAVPIVSNWNIDYNKDTDELIINPSGKGLFSGHPVMG